MPAALSTTAGHMSGVAPFLVLVFNLAWACSFGPRIAHRYLGPDSLRPAVVAAATAVTGAAALTFGMLTIPRLPWLISVGVAIVSVGWLAAFIDHRVHLLPDSLTLLLAANTIFIIVAAPTGSTGAAPVVGAVLWLPPLLLGAFAGQVGAGDVKLGAVLGALLGVAGLGTAALGLVVALISAGTSGLANLVRQRRPRQRLALGPHLLVGATMSWALLCSGMGSLA